MNHLATSRRAFFRFAAIGGTAGLLAYTGHAQPTQPPQPPVLNRDDEFVTAETQAAIDRGLAFLARVQREDGSFSDRFGGAAVGIASLCGLALMAGGHQSGHGRYGRVVSRTLDYVLASGNNPQGFLGGIETLPGGFRNQNQQAMYGHGFGCLFLAEVCGMVPETARQARVKAALERAVAYIVAARNREGGWRYDPQPATADVSVTVAQMMALRAAKNAGVFVRKNVIDAGADYIRACQLPDGGFSYFKGQGYSAFARSAAAIVGLYSAGVYSGREIDRGLKYIRQFLPIRQFAFREIPPQHYYYGQYYAALAMWTAGGDHWQQWFPAIRDELLARARTGGAAWADNYHGPAYATAMSLIVLQLPNNYLPILQK